MIVDVSKKILIVGLGLLGGSYAKVLKRFGVKLLTPVDREKRTKTAVSMPLSGFEIWQFSDTGRRISEVCPTVQIICGRVLTQVRCCKLQVS